MSIHPFHSSYQERERSKRKWYLRHEYSISTPFTCIWSYLRTWASYPKQTCCYTKPRQTPSTNQSWTANSSSRYVLSLIMSATLWTRRVWACMAMDPSCLTFCMPWSCGWKVGGQERWCLKCWSLAQALPTAAVAHPMVLGVNWSNQPLLHSYTMQQTPPKHLVSLPYPRIHWRLQTHIPLHGENERPPSQSGIAREVRLRAVSILTTLTSRRTLASNS